MKNGKRRIPRTWSVVATAHTERGLREAAALRPGSGVDLVEVRLDCLTKLGDRLPRILCKIETPLILTARHPREGGSGELGSPSRRALLSALLPRASMIDVELRSAGTLRDVLALARKHRVRTILSFHDFRGTPSSGKLRKKIREGLRLGAAVVKLATTLRDARDLSLLMELQRAQRDVAAMGMGPWGKVSRLVLPMAGAKLVYGYLDRPQVEGQWPARLLAARLEELAS